jgi:hypothetical protein
MYALAGSAAGWVYLLWHNRAECLCPKEPLKDLGSPLAQWVTQALLNPGAETVQRNTKSCDTNLLHLCSFLLDFCANSFCYGRKQHQNQLPQLTEKT